MHQNLPLKCIDCGNEINIINDSQKDYTIGLNEEERIEEIKNLINSNNFSYKKIQSCICISCLNEYLHLIKQKTDNTISKNDEYLESLCDLLKDITNLEANNDSNELTTGVTEEEIESLKKKYKTIQKDRISAENILNQNKNELNKLKNEEEEIYKKININNRKNIDYEENLRILKLKLKYLNKQYETIAPNK